MLIKRSLIILVYMISLITILATSNPHPRWNSLTEHKSISSDCPNSIDSADGIIVFENKIIEPENISFLNFGFPSDTVNSDEDVVGLINGIERICEVSMTNFEAGEKIFSCIENEEVVCTIFIN